MHDDLPSFSDDDLPSFSEPMTRDDPLMVSTSSMAIDCDVYVSISVIHAQPFVNVCEDTTSTEINNMPYMHDKENKIIDLLF